MTRCLSGSLAFWLAIAVAGGAANAQPAAVAISDSLCVAANDSQVDCRGVTFAINGRAASRFIEDFINRRYRGKVFTTNEQLQQNLLELKAGFEQHAAAVEALTRKVEVLERDRAAEGLIEDRSDDRARDRELLMEQLQVVLQLKEATANLSAKYEDLEGRMRETEARLDSFWTGYSPEKWRLRLATFYEYRVAETERLHGWGLAAALRFPLPFVVQLGGSWAHVWGTSDATYVGGEPVNVVLETADADADGEQWHFEAGLGYELEAVAFYASFGPRITTLTRRLDGAPRHDSSGWDWPLTLTLEVRPIVGLVVWASGGRSFDDGVRASQYRYGVSGRTLSAGDGAAPSSTTFIRAGLGYVGVL